MKVNLQTRQESLARTEIELRQEMAAALGRIGRTLEDAIQQLHEIGALARSDAEKITLRPRYFETRKKAQLYFWYLLVQREAVGLRDHSEVRNHFVIPPAL